MRALAQDGYKAALSRHPWMAARQLPSVIGPLSDAAAQPHEAKGAAYLGIITKHSFVVIIN